MRDRRTRRVPNWAIGLTLIGVIATAMLVSATGRLPWAGGYELDAVFADTQGMVAGTPVRVAGVNVGEVTGVEHLEGSDLAGSSVASRAPREAVLVTMRITDEGRPVHTDATLRLRPRLFLEGNYFVQMSPGTPEAPEAPDGYVVPVTNTSGPVQLDQVLTTAQSDVRRDLQTTLHELSVALVKAKGDKGLRVLARTSGPAFKSTAVVNQALLGTHPHDLSGLIRNLAHVTSALNGHATELQALVGHLDTVTGALAAQAHALERSVADLPSTIDAAQPALRAINDSLPQVRAFAIDALPGVRALPPALDAARPFMRQLRALVSRPELRGLAHDLRPTIPRVGHLVRGTLPFLDQARALSSCFNQVVIPWANMTVPDPETPATGRIFEETGYGLVGISGESRSADANGPYARVLGGSGSNFVVFPPFDGTSDKVFGAPPLPILGARPSLQSSAKPPFRPDVPCETDQPPNLDSGAAAAPPQTVAHYEHPPGAIDPTAALRARLAGIGHRLHAATGTLGDPKAAPVSRRRAGKTARDAVNELNDALAGALGWRTHWFEGTP
jgi:phospholipid/cholesterol/gamma-HCH transport system substrate-binding protein